MTEARSRDENPPNVGTRTGGPGGADATVDEIQNRDIAVLKRRETALFWVAVLGCVIACSSTFISLLQWNVMREQLTDARGGAVEQQKVTDRALSAAASQADSLRILAAANRSLAASAAQSLSSSDQAVRLHERAWLGVSGASNFIFGGVGPDDRMVPTKDMVSKFRPSVDVAITNSGATPARSVTVCGVMTAVFNREPFRPFWAIDGGACPEIMYLAEYKKYPVGDRPEIVAAETIRRRAEITGAIVNPHDSLPFHLQAGIGTGKAHDLGMVSTDDIEWYQGEIAAYHVYLTIRVRYVDDFGTSHELRWCRRWLAPSDTLLPCSGFPDRSD